MAKEYIEREAAVKVLSAEAVHCVNNFKDGEARAYLRARNIVAKLPTADVVEVVRCKDCIHWLNEEGLDDHVCLKIYSDGAVSQFAWQHREPNDFCSYGERRTDE